MTVSKACLTFPWRAKLMGIFHFRLFVWLGISTIKSIAWLKPTIVHMQTALMLHKWFGMKYYWSWIILHCLRGYDASILFELLDGKNLSQPSKWEIKKKKKFPDETGYLENNQEFILQWYVADSNLCKFARQN